MHALPNDPADPPTPIASPPSLSDNNGMSIIQDQYTADDSHTPSHPRRKRSWLSGLLILLLVYVVPFGFVLRVPQGVRIVSYDSEMNPTPVYASGNDTVNRCARWVYWPLISIYEARGTITYLHNVDSSQTGNARIYWRYAISDLFRAEPSPEGPARLEIGQELDGKAINRMGFVPLPVRERFGTGWTYFEYQMTKRRDRTLAVLYVRDSDRMIVRWWRIVDEEVDKSKSDALLSEAITDVFKHLTEPDQ